MQNVKIGEYIKIVSQRGIMEATILQLCNKFGANDKLNADKKMLNDIRKLCIKISDRLES